MTKKTEFKWDNETEVKVIEVSEYERRVVSITELKGKQYVCVATHKKIKGDFKPIKNATFTMDVWEQVADAVTDFKLGNAFGSTTKLEAPKTKKAPAKAKETPKATIKGKKPTYEEKLQTNGNFKALSKDKQVKAIEQVSTLHEEYGMVSIGISKTNFFVVFGKSQMEAEKEIKKAKGFSRSAITFFA